MKLSELAAKVTSQAQLAEKILAEIKILKETLSDVNLPAEAEASLARLDAALAAGDAENPDAPAPE